MTNQTTLIIGANSEIAKALASNIINDINQSLIVISRDVHFYQQDKFDHVKTVQIKNYQECEIKAALADVMQDITISLSQVYICNGLLHNESCQPEKRIEDFSPENFNQLINANTITPMLWLKHLTPFIAGKSDCKIILFNARVGSISDNKTGGWYSYRASKAAMNMLIKSVAVEFSRKAKNVKLISFHPGTTDSPLSKPFQKNVPEGKLFTPVFVAKQLLMIVENATIDGTATFIDWQGKTIAW